MSFFLQIGIFCSISTFSLAEHFSTVVENANLDAYNPGWSHKTESLLECAMLCEGMVECMGFGYGDRRGSSCVLRRTTDSRSWKVYTAPEDVGAIVFQAESAFTGHDVIVYEPDEGSRSITDYGTAEAKCSLIGKNVAGFADLQVSFDGGVQLCTYCWASDAEVYYVVSADGTPCGAKGLYRVGDQRGNACCLVRNSTADLY